MPEVLVNTINWKGQGTITWGTVVLAIMIPFFTIVYNLRPKEQECKRIKEEWKQIGSAIIILICGVISIYQVIYYYKLTNLIQTEYYRFSINLNKGFSLPPLGNYIIYRDPEHTMIYFILILIIIELIDIIYNHKKDLMATNECVKNSQLNKHK